MWLLIFYHITLLKKEESGWVGKGWDENAFLCCCVNSLEFLAGCLAEKNKFSRIFIIFFTRKEYSAWRVKGEPFSVLLKWLNHANGKISFNLLQSCPCFAQTFFSREWDKQILVLVFHHNSKPFLMLCSFSYSPWRGKREGKIWRNKTWNLIVLQNISIRRDIWM